MAQNPEMVSEVKVAKVCESRTLSFDLSPHLILLSTGQSLEQNSLPKKKKFKFLSRQGRAPWVLISTRDGSLSISFLPASAHNSIPGPFQTTRAPAHLYILPKVVTENIVLAVLKDPV